MAGTVEGGRKAVNTVKQRYGLDAYKEIGRLGGLLGRGGGFAKDPKLASQAGRIGGAKSRRGPKQSRLIAESTQVKLQAHAQTRARDARGRFAAESVQEELDLPKFTLAAFTPYCDGNHVALKLLMQGEATAIKNRYYGLWLLSSLCAVLATYFLT